MQRYSRFGEMLKQAGISYPSGLMFLDLQYNGRVIYHRVQYEDWMRIDRIAYIYLRDFEKWPLILWYNCQYREDADLVPPLRDPIRDIKVGTVLAIPIDPISYTSDIKPRTYNYNV